MLGIDIYERYQNVNDWTAVARHGVGFCWVKGTDGGGLAVVHADRFVAGAKRAGIPVGLYHYAQKSPSPEAQADVLIAEVRRLGATGLPPALDIEDPFVPGGAARDFAVRFLRRLVDVHGVRPAIYGNTSMFSAIRPDTMGIPGLVIWAADYGANTGVRNPDLRPYTGRADVHQYTSNGIVPGIAGRVDLNETITDAISGGGQEDDVNQEEHDALIEIRDQLRKIGPATAGYAAVGKWHHHTAAGDTIADAASIAYESRGLLRELAARPVADVDEAALAAELDARGIGGVSAAELIDILSGVRLAPAQPEGGTA